ncbi:phosphorylase b kinase regulatory subunit beta, partial [Biomphalaria pfeifferi]
IKIPEHKHQSGKEKLRKHQKLCIQESCCNKEIKMNTCWMAGYETLNNQVKHQILQYQSPINVLFPSIGSDKNTNRIAHVPDSIYCIVAVWSLAQVYKKIDDDQGRIISWAKLMMDKIINEHL